MGAKNDKTNVMRVLESKKIVYKGHTYTPDATMTGEEIARLLGEPVDHVFKTLVTGSKSGAHYVYVIPVNCSLDLKKAAAAAGEKYVEMLPQKDLLPLTGYVHGGCSPVGMKKSFPVWIQKEAENLETIFVSGGKVGFQVELAFEDLRKVVRLSLADLTTGE